MKPDMIELIERRGPALSLHLRKLAHKANAASWDIDSCVAEPAARQGKRSPREQPRLC
jgi:hypothetical protein